MGPPRLVDSSTTRCCLVPKDYKGPRLISAESAATQYLQQGQMRKMMSYIDHHPLLSRSIKLRDQTHNQRLCRDAYDNGACTLDLSNASDNVSATLVWYLLRDLPRLRSQLFSTRSQSIQLGLERVRLASFSPMGSAVCFPVETLVFWSLSLASVRHVQAQWGADGYSASLPSLKESASCVAVFGDDIIIPDYARQTLVCALQDVGCEINTSKTCYLTPFRESCGSEWFNSTDVSIIRNKRYYYDSARRIANYPELLDLQRKFFLCGLLRSAALLQRWAREIGPIVTVDIERVCPPLANFVSSQSSFWSLGQRSAYKVNKPSVRHRVLSEQGHGGSATAFPSGLDIFVRHAFPFDKYCSAIGWDSSLDSGVPIRSNQAFQRVECRLPTVFQLCREWPSSATESRCIPEEIQACRDRSDYSLKKEAALRLTTGYPRLLARLAGDYVERIAIRTHKVKMAWSELPFLVSFKTSSV
jgi:hypothetical protein